MLLVSSLPDLDAQDVATMIALHVTLVDALATLPVGEQQALGLTYFGHLTNCETAAALNIPLGTVKTRIRLGLTRLRALLL